MLEPGAMYAVEKIMEIIVVENDAIRVQYSWVRLFRYIYYFFVFLVVGHIFASGIWFALPGALFLYTTGVPFTRNIRISAFRDEQIVVTWPDECTIAYESIRRIINLSPYDYNVHYLLIIYRNGFLLEKYHMCWIPADQSIIEHLKAHNVKIWNLWFWQEKN